MGFVITLTTLKQWLISRNAENFLKFRWKNFSAGKLFGRFLFRPENVSAENLFRPKKFPVGILAEYFSAEIIFSADKNFGRFFFRPKDYPAEKF